MNAIEFYNYGLSHKEKYSPPLYVRLSLAVPDIGDITYYRGYTFFHTAGENMYFSKSTDPKDNSLHTYDRKKIFAKINDIVLTKNKVTFLFECKGIYFQGATDNDSITHLSFSIDRVVRKSSFTSTDVTKHTTINSSESENLRNFSVARDINKETYTTIVGFKNPIPISKYYNKTLNIDVTVANG